jgi:hypothetical protein
MDNDAEWVRCCETTRESDIIYLWNGDTFTLSVEDNVELEIQYCPWCGKLLDTNLLGD